MTKRPLFAFALSACVTWALPGSALEVVGTLQFEPEWRTEGGAPYRLHLDVPQIFSGDDLCGEYSVSEMDLWINEYPNVTAMAGRRVTVAGQVDCPRAAYVITNPHVQLAEAVVPAIVAQAGAMPVATGSQTAFLGRDAPAPNLVRSGTIPADLCRRVSGWIEEGKVLGFRFGPLVVSKVDVQTGIVTGLFSAERTTEVFGFPLGRTEMLSWQDVMARVAECPKSGSMDWPHQYFGRGTGVAYNAAVREALAEMEALLADHAAVVGGGGGGGLARAEFLSRLSRGNAWPDTSYWQNDRKGVVELAQIAFDSEMETLLAAFVAELPAGGLSAAPALLDKMLAWLKAPPSGRRGEEWYGRIGDYVAAALLGDVTERIAGALAAVHREDPPAAVSQLLALEATLRLGISSEMWETVRSRTLKSALDRALGHPYPQGTEIAGFVTAAHREGVCPRLLGKLPSGLRGRNILDARGASLIDDLVCGIVALGPVSVRADGGFLGFGVTRWRIDVENLYGSLNHGTGYSFVVSDRDTFVKELGIPVPPTTDLLLLSAEKIGEGTALDYNMAARLLQDASRSSIWPARLSAQN